MLSCNYPQMAFDNNSTDQDYNIVSFNQMYNELKKFWANISESNKRHDLRERQYWMSQQNIGLRCPVDSNFRNYINANIFQTLTWLAYDSHLDRDGIELALLACINATTRGKIHIQVDGDWCESSVLQVINFAPSGFRKSLVVSKLIAPFQEYEEIYSLDLSRSNRKLANILENKLLNKQADLYVAEVDFDNPDSIREALQKAKRNESYSTEDQSDIKKILISANTSSGLRKELKNVGGSGLLLNAEGTDFSKFLSSNELELLLKTYTQERYSYINSREDTRLKQPSLYLSLFAQERFAGKIFGSRKLNDCGFTARILPIITLSQQHNNFSFISVNDRDDYSKKIVMCLKIFEKIHDKIYINLTQEAYLALQRVESEINSLKVDIEYFSTWTKKVVGNIVRCALAYHIWNDPVNATVTSITLQEVLSATEIVKMAFKTAQFLFDPLGLRAHIVAKRIVKSYLRIQNPQEQQYFLNCGTTTTKIQQRTGLNRIAINDALRVLAGKNIVVFLDDGSGNFNVLPRLDFYRINWS